MVQHAADEYGSMGSVPTAQPTGLNAPQLGVHANPEEFGAQIGAGVQKVGQASEELAAKYGQMVNENLMTQADVSFATKLGQLKANYTTKTGQAAWDAFPQYQADVAQAFQESRANLPVGAQHGFDMLGARTMANHIADGSNHAVSQLKEANRDSYSSLANTSVQALLDPAVASNPERSQYHLDTLRYAAQAQMDTDHPGLNTDPKTGTVSFNEDTPEGKNLKANFQQRLDTYLAQGYTNKYDTLAKQDVFGAYNAYQQDRSNMPKSAQVALDASFGPRLQAAHNEIATGHTLNEAARDHFDVLTNPSKQIANAIFTQESGNKFGNQTSSSGAIGGAQIMPATFSQYAKAGEDINNPEDNKAVGQRIIDGYTKRYNGDASRVAVAYFSGPGNVAPAGSPTPYIKDTADSDGKHVSSYVSDVTGRLGEKPKTYATNENGAPLSLADYYRTNSNEILKRGDEYAEKQMPGDLALKRLVRETLTNSMNKTISNENAQHIMDNKNVMRGINGELTKGKPPETEAELRAIPGMGQLLDKVATQDPKFLDSIPTLIGKVARRNDVTNSANGYDAIQRVLSPEDDPNHIKGQDHLDKLLGLSDGTGINAKDYADAKPATELGDNWKQFLSKNMKEVSTANGNVDGKGNDRAVAWYNQAMKLKKDNDSKGDKALSDDNLIKQIDEVQHGHKPSLMEQLTNLVKGKQTLPTIASPNDPAFQQLQSGAQFQTADGQIRTKK